MYGITDPLTFLVGTILIVLLPGPNSLFVLAVASSQGIAPGYRAAMGVFTGDFLLMCAASMGAASLLLAHPLLFMLLQYAGATYLAYIGVSLLRLAYRHWRSSNSHDPAAMPTPPKARVSQPFRRALLISLVNPKAIFFFMSFFVQFVDPSYPHPAVTFLLLGVIVQICSFFYLTALIFAGSTLASLVRSHPRVSALGSASVGVLFIGFGLRLANASISQ